MAFIVELNGLMLDIEKETFQVNKHVTLSDQVTNIKDNFYNTKS